MMYCKSFQMVMLANGISCILAAYTGNSLGYIYEVPIR